MYCLDGIPIDNAQNAGDYLKAGANLLSFGASIFAPKLMESGDWEEIGKRLTTLLDSVKKAL